MATRIVFIEDSTKFKKGEEGFVDGYCNKGRDNGICAIVVKDDGMFVTTDLSYIKAKYHD